MAAEILNGSEHTEPTAEQLMSAAQQRLSKAALSQTINPSSAAISAYVTSVLTSARLSGLIAFLTTEYNASWTKEEALDAAIIGSLNAVAAELEEKARKIQVAGPAILPPH